jgi:hypothetical protein
MAPAPITVIFIEALVTVVEKLSHRAELPTVSVNHAPAIRNRLPCRKRYGIGEISRKKGKGERSCAGSKTVQGLERIY